MQVPGRPNLAFTGQVGDIWYVIRRDRVLMIYVQAYRQPIWSLSSVPVSAFLYWILIRWLVANFSPTGSRLPITFNGSALGLYRLVYC